MSNFQRNETGSDNHRGALPLSIFGDEELETDDSPNIQDAFTFKPSYPRNGINSQGSNISINDLISNLYCQAEQIPPVDDAGKHTGNGLDSSNEVMDLTLVNSDDDFEDSSWDFKDASIQTSTIDQTSLRAQGDTCDNFTTNSHMINFRDFYCKLKDELSAVCRGHLNNLMVGILAKTFLWIRLHNLHLILNIWIFHFAREISTLLVFLVKMQKWRLLTRKSRLVTCPTSVPYKCYFFFFPYFQHMV